MLPLICCDPGRHRRSPRHAQGRGVSTLAHAPLRTPLRLKRNVPAMQASCSVRLGLIFGCRPWLAARLSRRVGGVPLALVFFLSGRRRCCVCSAGRESLQASDGSGDVGCPGPSFGEAEPQAPAAAGQASGDGEQAEPEPLRLPAAGLPGEGDELGPGQQFAGQGDDLAPGLVLGEAPEREVAQPGVLGAADTVLAGGGTARPAIPGTRASRRRSRCGSAPCAAGDVAAGPGPAGSSRYGRRPCSTQRFPPSARWPAALRSRRRRGRRRRSWDGSRTSSSTSARPAPSRYRIGSRERVQGGTCGAQVGQRWGRRWRRSLSMLSAR